jgi:cyclophilin family peptidyl-prolyl cis-trans isomerase/protein-disulfide isomerase
MKKIFPILTLAVFLLASCTSTKLSAKMPTDIAIAPTQPPGRVPTETLGAALANTSAALPTTTPDTPLVIKTGAMMPGCTVISIKPTPASPENSVFGAVTEQDWVAGPLTATVTLLEFSDFQCPGCAAVAPVLARVAEEFPNDVRFVYRHFPLLSIHDKASLAVQAAEAAGRQGKFWDMHDLLFAKQSEWSLLTLDDFKTWLASQAATLELDVVKFNVDLVDPALVKIANDAWEKGQQIGLPGTPFLVLNDELWPSDLPKSYEMISAVVSLTLLQNRQYDRCPSMIIDRTKQYFATIETTKGNLVLELYADKSPLAVNNFVFLAREGWYDGVSFHRVVADFMAQTGDPSGTGYGGPGYAFKIENSPDLSFNQPGVVAMANSGPDTNGSQFFITYAPATHLDGVYTIFGRLIEGADVLEALNLRDPQTDNPLPEPDLILKVTIEEK